jgi:hypothetical protein
VDVFSNKTLPCVSYRRKIILGANCRWACGARPSSNPITFLWRTFSSNLGPSEHNNCRMALDNERLKARCAFFFFFFAPQPMTAKPMLFFRPPKGAALRADAFPRRQKSLDGRFFSPSPLPLVRPIVVAVYVRYKLVPALS